MIDLLYMFGVIGCSDDVEVIIGLFMLKINRV